MNKAAEFLSRLEMDPNEKIILEYREKIPGNPIEVNNESTGLAQEETVFLRAQTNTRLQKKNFGNVQKKHKMPY